MPKITEARIIFAGRKWIVAKKDFPTVAIGSAEKLVDYCNRNLISVINKDCIIEKFRCQLNY